MHGNSNTTNQVESPQIVLYEGINSKKNIVDRFPEITWDEFQKMEELRGRSIELIEDFDAIPCEEANAPEVMAIQPLVSVHMITYNHEKYIEEAILGVVNQQCKFPFELIIGEDCSTDNTRKICLDYQKKYPKIIRVLFSENNTGMIRNSYRCILRCRGKYIAFCEGDDYWNDDNKLQKQYNDLENNPDVGIFHSNAYVYSKNQFLIAKQNPEQQNYHSKKPVKHWKQYYDVQFPPLTCTVMIRNNILQSFMRTSFFSHCIFNQADITTQCECLKQGANISFRNEIMSVYRVNANSVLNKSINSWVSSRIDSLIVCYFYAKYCNKRYTFKQVSRDILSARVLSCIDTKSRKTLLKIFALSLKYCCGLTFKSYLRIAYYYVKLSVVLHLF